MLFQKASRILQRTTQRNSLCTFTYRRYGLTRRNLIPLTKCCLETPRELGTLGNFQLDRPIFKQKYGEPRYFHHSPTIMGEIKVVSTPVFPDSVTEGDIRWDKGVGDAVEEDEVIGEIETDKTALAVTAPAAGVIVELLVNDGDTVEKGQELFKLDTSGDGSSVAASPQTKEEKPVAKQEEQVEKPVEREIPTVPPPVPEKPKEPLKVVTPKAAPAPPPTPMQTGLDVTQQPMGGRTESRIKISRMRQRIAQRMKEAQNTAAMLTTFNEVDMSNIMDLRQKHKDEFLKKHNVKLGFMSAFVKASAHALQQIPVVNAVIDDDNNQIVYRDYIDISVAVATPKGLVVPVIRNAGTMNYADIEKTINMLGQKARDGDLAIEEMDGGTFTISNGGVFGSLMGTPIINPPQSAILGIHAINDRPVAINGKVEIRPMMYLALTYDHRLIDGREAVTFLRKIKSCVEDPRTILLDL